jgi:ubiquinone/menaquinone biosynthesis C-methylase UbiE
MKIGILRRSAPHAPIYRLTERKTMLNAETGSRLKTVQLFYDDLAPNYDHEQFQTAVSMSKRKEYDLFSSRLPELFAGAGRVLEIGAGTGIFTIPIARHCREVVAVDISRNMLEVLAKKAADEGVTNIRTVLCDVEQSSPEGTFSVICAFASLEYMADVPGLLRRLARHLEPGGVIYFITARRSFLRFFIQFGNAVRQKLWLKSHSPWEIREMLRAAGCGQIEIHSHLFKVFRYGGMLLEVVARRAAGADSSAVRNQNV